MEIRVETVVVSIDGFNKEGVPISTLRVDVENSTNALDIFIAKNVCSENDCEIDTCIVETLQREGFIMIQAEKCFARICKNNSKKFCPLKKRVIIQTHNKSVNK